MAPVVAIKDATVAGFGTIGLLLGQAIPEGLGALIQGGAFAVLAYAFLHMIIRTLPAYQKCQENQQKAFMAALDKIAARNAEDERVSQENIRKLTQAINDLRVHCAAQHRD